MCKNSNSVCTEGKSLGIIKLIKKDRTVPKRGLPQSDVAVTQLPVHVSSKCVDVSIAQEHNFNRTTMSLSESGAGSCHNIIQNIVPKSLRNQLSTMLKPNG